MAQDIIYYFDNITHERKELGEIQTNFNFNLVIDGTKDSEQIDVYSFQRDALRPNTILYHNATQTWWVVRKDQVKRNANEQGYWYQHSITLNGAIDLLGSRDLTDCGMNANDYTIETFFNKLLKLSTFEFEYQINYGEDDTFKNIDKDQKVSYIKSYENYTLLSAIRDFFNGYNCEVKMTFATKVVSNKTYLDYAIFTIIPRTGNIDLTPISIDVFDDIRENINFDKESFGTTVISNAQNVVSTETKIFPQVGGVKLTGTDYETSISSAYIKLPSPAWKVNWVKAICPLTLYVKTRDWVPYRTIYGYDFEMVFNSLLNVITDQEIKSLVIASKDKCKTLWDNCTLTFYNNTKYNAKNGTYGEIIKEDDVPYIGLLRKWDYRSETIHKTYQVALMDKESAELLKDKEMALVWERGSDKITGLESLFNADASNFQEVVNLDMNNCDLSKIGYADVLLQNNTYVKINAKGLGAVASSTPLYQVFIKGETCFQVSYIPMNDLKVKQDNENNTKDSKLYNQNGKLNDSVALSKMIDSYSKEIINPTITRYMEYTNFNSIPKVGQIVMDGNTRYVINNISYNVYPNESNSIDSVGYYYECEFTLAMYVSTKSIMTSPNTNVRDYGIPQKYNIKRRQTYRDYYEFDFIQEPLANQSTPYAHLENYLYFDTPYIKKDYDHTALIKIDYANEVSGQMSWYYQINSTAYVMNKTVYEIIDFNDNNIIGYDIQNSTSGFNMSHLWDSTYRAVTTPVSYVDDNGQFVGITLQMTNAKNLANAYSQVDTQGESVMFSAHCFINDTLYDMVANPQTHVNSEETNDTNIFLATNRQQSFTRNIVVNADDIGIPDYVEIDQDNIVGLVDVNVENGEYQLDSNDYTLSIVNYLSDRRIQVQLSIVADQNKNVIEKLGGTSSDTTLAGSLSINFKVEYIDNKPLSDYVIDEPNYEKDAIEVPVFEYSLQIGDTKDVEVGDNILLNKECIMCPLTATRSSGILTTLNATSYEGNLTCDGQSGQYDPQTQTRRFVINAGNLFPIITLEDNNTKMRIKFYNSNSWYVDGNEDETIFNYVGEVNPITPSTQQVSKATLMNSDIVIFKNFINSIKYKGGLYNTLNFDRNLLFIIHKPTADQFDGDDLILNINYYKLK